MGGKGRERGGEEKQERGRGGGGKEGRLRHGFCGDGHP